VAEEESVFEVLEGGIELTVLESGARGLGDLEGQVDSCGELETGFRVHSSVSYMTADGLPVCVVVVVVAWFCLVDRRPRREEAKGDLRCCGSD
jgi:hypothetical protein